MINQFFHNKGPFKIDKILKSIKIEYKYNYFETMIFDIKDLVNATNKDITFFHSKKI